jgi:uncharacterized protein (TIGR03086 family)
VEAQHRDPLRALADAASVAQQAVDGVADDRWSSPSTCDGWSVEDVVRHLVEGNERLAATLGATTEPADGGWSGRLRSSAAAVADRLGEPGALERPVTVPAGTMPGAAVVGLRTVEHLVHGWDVATSTGRRLDVPDDLVAHADRVTRQLLERLPPGRTPFQPPTTPPDDATPLDRLAALLGRRVDDRP